VASSTIIRTCCSRLSVDFPGSLPAARRDQTVEQRTLVGDDRSGRVGFLPPWLIHVLLDVLIFATAALGVRR
jgi:hypothetical protein